MQIVALDVISILVNSIIPIDVITTISVNNKIVNIAILACATAGRRTSVVFVVGLDMDRGKTVGDSECERVDDFYNAGQWRLTVAFWPKQSV